MYAEPLERTRRMRLAPCPSASPNDALSTIRHNLEYSVPFQRLLLTADSAHHSTSSYFISTLTMLAALSSYNGQCRAFEFVPLSFHHIHHVTIVKVTMPAPQPPRHGHHAQSSKRKAYCLRYQDIEASDCFSCHPHRQRNRVSHEEETRDVASHALHNGSTSTRSLVVVPMGDILYIPIAR